METSPEAPNSGRPPLGVYTSRCDDKGRLRMPKEFEDFMRTFSEPEFFVTSLDGNIARIYPIRTWMENEKVLEASDDISEAAEGVAYTAHYYGAVTTIDAQGRVLVPPVLRRQMQIEDQKVNVGFYRGAVEVYSEAESDRRLARAKETLAMDRRALEKRGFK